MSRHPTKEPPDGYGILRINGRYYPVRLLPDGVTAHALDRRGSMAAVTKQDRPWDYSVAMPVSYAKRADAVAFCARIEAPTPGGPGHA